LLEVLNAKDIIFVTQWWGWRGSNVVKQVVELDKSDVAAARRLEAGKRNDLPRRMRRA